MLYEKRVSCLKQWDEFHVDCLPAQETRQSFRERRNRDPSIESGHVPLRRQTDAHLITALNTLQSRCLRKARESSNPTGVDYVGDDWSVKWMLMLGQAPKMAWRAVETMFSRHAQRRRAFSSLKTWTSRGVEIWIMKMLPLQPCLSFCCYMYPGVRSKQAE